MTLIFRSLNHQDVMPAEGTGSPFPATEKSFKRRWALMNVSGRLESLGRPASPAVFSKRHVSSDLACLNRTPEFVCQTGPFVGQTAAQSDIRSIDRSGQTTFGDSTNVCASYLVSASLEMEFMAGSTADKLNVHFPTPGGICDRRPECLGWLWL